MKKILALFAVIVLLFSLAGCSLFAPAPTTEAVSMTESTTSESPTSKPEKELIDFPKTKPLPAGYSFTSFYAATPTHFYALAERTAGSSWDRKLVRAPINSIGQQEDIPLPEEHDGYPLSRPRICGISPEWVYVSLAKESLEGWNGWVVYRISLETGKSEFVVRCDSPAWYNMGSECLLLPYNGRIEARNLSTGEGSLIYENEELIYLDDWENLADGTIILRGSWRIDAANQVKREDISYELRDDARLDKPTTEAEKALAEGEKIRSYAACNGWLYSVEWSALGNGSSNLWRMKPDGTEKELLREDTHVYQLLAVNNKLFAMAAYPINVEEEDWTNDKLMLHELDAMGKPLWNKACGFAGENNWYNAWRFGDMLLVTEHTYGDGRYEWFTMLYDPATGQSIEGKIPE